MKKIFSIILCAAVVIMAGCETKKEQSSRIMSEIRKDHESSMVEESIAHEAEIEEVDKWGVSLDDVEQLAKQAIRKHENVSDYRQDYRKAIHKTDDFLEDVESGKAVEYSLEYFIKKYDEACFAGIEYIKACVDVEFTYNMYTQYGEFTKSEKDNIRFFLTMFNSSIEDVEQSIIDMDSLLNPIIEENRKLTDDELEKVFEIYQVLIDNVDIASKSY